MRIVSLLNQKGGVGKTTTAVNLGAALALEGRRVVLVDLDPQANLSVHLGLELASGEPSTYAVLLGQAAVADVLRPTATPGLSVVPTDLDLSGAELELASQFGRETLLRDAHRARTGEDPADYVLLDCPPSLGLLSINALAASDEVLICVQTEFFALRGLTKLIDVVALVQRRLHPGLSVGGILPCLYDSRLRLAREVLGELKGYFGDLVFARAIGVNVKLAEAPSYGQTIFEYAPDSPGARDYRTLARDLIARAAGVPVAPSEFDAAAPDDVTSAVASGVVGEPKGAEEREPAGERTRDVPASTPSLGPVETASRPARAAADVTPEGEVRDVLVVPRRNEARAER